MSGIERPIFIVSPPRSGSSLLFRTLMQAPGVFTIGGESHQLIEGMKGLHPRDRGWHSNALSAEDAEPELATALRGRFFAALRDRRGLSPSGPVQMIEKTPKNSLRVPFLAAAFENAHFVFLHRNVRETLSSMIEAWQSGRFRTYPNLPGWEGSPWSLLLTPGWRDLRGRALHDIVAHQWAATTRKLLDDLAAVPKNRIRALSYQQLVDHPQETIFRLTASLGLSWDREIKGNLPLSPSVVSPPEGGKWRRHADLIGSVLPIVEPEAKRAEALVAEFGGD